MTRPEIRFDKPSDWPEIERICAAAFGRSAEFDLLCRLRDDNDLAMLLVAESAAAVAGVAAFSELAIEGAELVRAAALAPIAVDPDRQASGVGAALIRAGIAQCRKKGIGAIVVLGYPRYYARFGFSTEAAAGIEAPWSGPNLMALSLRDETPALVGRARYPAAFEAERERDG